MGENLGAARIGKNTEHLPHAINHLAVSSHSQHFGVPNARTGPASNATRLLIYLYFKPLKNLLQCFTIVLLSKMDVGALGIKYLQGKQYPRWSCDEHLGINKTVQKENYSMPFPSLHQQPRDLIFTACLFGCIWVLRTEPGTSAMMSRSSPISCIAKLSPFWQRRGQGIPSSNWSHLSATMPYFPTHPFALTNQDTE